MSREKAAEAEVHRPGVPDVDIRVKLLAATLVVPIWSMLRHLANQDVKEHATPGAKPAATEVANMEIVNHCK